MSRWAAVAKRVHTAWIFPIVVGLLFVVLTASGLNGSSIGALSAAGRGSSDVVAGTPRSIRSDEFYVRTPIVIGQEERGFPSTVESGVGEHDVTVLVDLPTTNWSMVFRPHEWGYAFLPLDQAFAFDWWGLSAVLLLGTYGFLLVITRRPLWSSIGAVAFWASPFFAWWYLALSLAVAGYGLGGAALLLASFHQGLSPRLRWALVGAAAFVLSCFALTFYPPFQVPLAIVVVAVSVGATWHLVADGSTAWKRILVNVAVAGGVTAVVSGAYLLTRLDTLSAIMNTAYPGNRRVEGGGASPGYLTSAWFGLSYVRDPAGMRARVLPNESEASSFLLLGVFLLPVLPLLWGRITASSARLRGALIGALVGTGLIAAHMYVSLPGFVSRFSLLDRVPPQRAVIGLGVGALLIAVVVGVQLDRSESVSWKRRVACGAVTAVVAAGYVLNLATEFHQSGAPVGRRATLLALVGVCLVVGLFFFRPLFGLGALAVCGLAVSLPVNPLNHGLGTLTDAPLTRSIEQIAARSSGAPPGWLNTIDMSMPALAAAGVDDVSAVNLYPDHQAWALLDPHGTYRDIWNRYAHTRWVLDPDASEPRFGLLSNDTVSITLDPCGRQLDELRVGHVVTPKPIDAACLTKVQRTTALDGGPAYIYERTAGSER